MPTKILAIDDSKTMRLAIKITFAAEDADVTTVGKGGDAVARAKQTGADVVLVDHHLGEGEPSGYEVAEALASDDETASLPVVLLVSNQTGVDQSKFDACGAKAWVAKPFDSSELLAKVDEVLGRPAQQPAATGSRTTPAAAKPAAAVAKPAPVAAAKPAAAAPAAAKPKPVQPVPSSQPSSVPMTKPRPAASRPAAGADAHGEIPIAIPIPFTAADAPTPGMLQRLEAARGAATAGLDPNAVQALLSLSREVIEQAVWEVVPDLAEEIIKREAAKRAG